MAVLSTKTEDAAKGSCGPLEQASRMETAAYIEDLTRELEQLSRQAGLERLSDCLRAAQEAARRYVITNN